ncbi:MAG: HEAT repeat domain-containing protein [Candidatus Riflebacteria bacterium]|nr:HEAT repeat domain-containing protein [Candidatus Riflebacteria bacterium]
MENSVSENELLRKLKSDKRSVKLDAIMRLSKLSKSRLTQNELRNLASGGDREIAMYAALAISRIQARLGEKEESPPKESSLRNSLIAPLPTEIPALLEKIRSNPGDIPSEVRSLASDFLARNGNETDSEIVGGWLENAEGIGVFPLIDSLEALSPMMLIDKLPGLLSSSHPLVRGRAINALYRIDRQEALNHLTELLVSKNPEERYVGMIQTFHFPFPEVKEIILSLISHETDREVLNAAESVIISNPDIEIALNIWSLAEVSPKPFSKNLLKIFKSLAISIKEAGVLETGIDPVEALLWVWNQERLKIFVEDLEIQIVTADQEKRNAIKEWLTRNIGLPEVIAFVGKLALNPLTEDIARDLLPSRIQIEDEPVKSPSGQETADLDKLSQNEKISLLKKLDEKGFLEQNDWLRKEAISGEGEARRRAIKAFSQFSKEQSDEEIGWKALESKNPLICQNGFSLLQKLNPKKLFSSLPELIKRPITGNLYKIIDFALTVDRQTASKLAFEQLLSKESLHRAMILPALFFFPFDSIAGPLLSSLEIESHSEIAAKMILILITNPRQSTLERLDTMKNKANPAIDILIAQARIELFDSLLSLNLYKSPAAKKETEKSSIEKLPQKSISQSEPPSREIPRQKANDDKPSTEKVIQKSSTSIATKPYSIYKIRDEIRKQKESAWRSPSLSGIPTNWLGRIDWKSALLFGFSLALLALIPISFLKKSSESSSNVSSSSASNPRREFPEDNYFEKKASTEIDTGFILGRVAKVEGIVTGTFDKGLVRFSYGKTVLLIKSSKSFPKLSVGDKAVMEILPYRKLNTGEILADGYSANLR